MGVADRLRSWARNPWLVAGIIVGLLLIIAWIGGAIHVWSDHGARQGIGVLIVWPALLVAAALVIGIFIAIYLLIRRREHGSDDLRMRQEGSTVNSEEAEATETR